MKINESITIDSSTMQEFPNRKFIGFNFSNNDVSIIWKGIKISDSKRFTIFNSLSEAIRAWNRNDFYNLYY